MKRHLHEFYRAQRQKALRFLQCAEGVSYVEFALVLPFMLMLVLGGMETSRYILLNQKLNKTAITMADLVTQSKGITRPQIDVLYQAIPHLMEPYTFNGSDIAIVTSVGKREGDPPTVHWQHFSQDVEESPSHIGAQGEEAHLPDGFTLQDGEDAIIAEIFFDFSNDALVPNVMPEGIIYKIAVFRPRLGELDALAQ